MLAWMDLEMTGLDPARHVIVEIATLITDEDLAVVAECPDIVVHAGTDRLAEMDATVRAMHTTSGLLAAIQASPVSLEDAGRQTLEFLRRHIPEPRTVPLCGNSIGTDRRFLAGQCQPPPNEEDPMVADASDRWRATRRRAARIRPRRRRSRISDCPMISAFAQSFDSVSVLLRRRIDVPCDRR